MAARAHDVASIAIKGHLAMLNFPEFAHEFPTPASKCAKDIQSAAAMAAALEISPRNSMQQQSKGESMEVPSSPDEETGSAESSFRSIIEDPFLDLPDLLMDLSQKFYNYFEFWPEEDLHSWDYSHGAVLEVPQL
ncbi:unnamed protein product [Withania somnifera]